MKKTLLFALLVVLPFVQAAIISTNPQCDSALNEQYYDGGCGCAEGCNRINGLCRPCPSGTIYHPAAQACVSVCNNNSIWSETTHKCVCPPSYFNVSGVCVGCQNNQVFDSTTQCCKDVCQNGQLWDILIKKCRPQCLTNQTYSYNLGACICSVGTFNISGSCSFCKYLQIYSPSTQSCIPWCGINEYFNCTTNTCSCL